MRELAYAGRPDEAMAILATMTEGETARVLTYQGFLLRQTGRVEDGIAAYERAIALDTANILARSYYGQLLVQMNEMRAGASSNLPRSACMAAAAPGPNAPCRTPSRPA